MEEARPRLYTRLVAKVTRRHPNCSTSGPAKKLKKLERAKARLKISDTFVEDVFSLRKNPEKRIPKQLPNMDAKACEGEKGE